MQSTRAKKLFSLLVLFGLALAVVQPVQIDAQTVTPLTNELTGLPKEPVVAAIYYRDADHLNQIAGSLDIWEAHTEELYVVAMIWPVQYHWLQSLGYRLVIDIEKTEGFKNPEEVLDPRYAYFDDYFTNSNGLYLVNMMQYINSTYPDLTELIDIGDAWQAEHGGYHRDIWVLRVTNEDPAYGPIEDKPVFYLHGGIHAREVAIPELLIRYAHYLTGGYLGMGGYGFDPDVTWLVDHHTVYILVTSNPDGHVINEVDWWEYWRKNANNTLCGSGNFGIDLNRNHSFFFGCCGGSSNDPCSETYRGTARASEPETEAFQNHVMSVIPDQNGPNGDDQVPEAAPDDTMGILLTMHSYGNLTLLPWGASSLPDPANLAQLTTVGHKLAYFTSYTDFNLGYVTDGGTRDWGYGKLGIPSITFEVGPDFGNCGDFFPDYDCIDGTGGATDNFWAENRPAFIYAHKIAVTPYMTSEGPDTQNVAVTPASVPQGTLVTLTANHDDERCCGEPEDLMGGAEYFIDAPGADGTGTSMNAADGAWGGAIENSTITVDTTSLEPGQHYLLVHARNTLGDWGPLTAVFLTVTSADGPDIAVSPDNFMVTLEPGASFTGTVTVGNVGDDTLIYTGTLDAGWLTLIPSGGSLEPSEEQSHTLEVDAGSLAVGTYTGTISIASNDPVNPVVEVVVNLEVSEPPDIIVDPVTVTMTLGLGESGTSVVWIDNVGEGVLTILEINEDVAWLDVLPTAPFTILPLGEIPLNLSFDSDTLAIGEYEVELEIVSDDPDQPLVTVMVTLIVRHELYLPLVLR